jgi:hypothetical protein
MINMSLYDAQTFADGSPGHMTPERIAQIKASCLPHEVQTRVYGRPLMGAGAVFPIDPEAIWKPRITDVPPHWYKLWGIDFGIGHPFAAVLILGQGANWRRKHPVRVAPIDIFTGEQIEGEDASDFAWMMQRHEPGVVPKDVFQ